jgi:peroxiredoxin
VKVYEKYKDKGFVLLSVNVLWDKEAEAKQFVKEYGLTFPVGRDGSARISTAYKVDATPASFFIDRKGVLVERVTGEFQFDAEGEFSRRVEKLLAS